MEGREINLGDLSKSDLGSQPKSNLQGNNHTVIVEDMRKAVNSKMDVLFASLTKGDVSTNIYDKDQFNQVIRIRMDDVHEAVDRLEQEVRKLNDTVRYTGD